MRPAATPLGGPAFERTGEPVDGGTAGERALPEAVEDPLGIVLRVARSL
jgi:hypothetical protein